MHKNSSRIAELDLLRFVAALAVVFFHYGHYGRPEEINPLVARVTEVGFLGVQLFFMISGFVILWTANNKNGLEFIVSRISRLYPTFWVCVVLTAITLYVLRGTWSTYRLFANLTMIPGPFKQTALDNVYWTLVIEIKFYALIFCLIVTKQLPYIRRWLALWLGISVLAAIYPRWLHAVALDQFSVYFIAGCYLYLIRTQKPSIGLFAPLGVCAVLSVYNAVGVQTVFTNDPSVWASVSVSVIVIAQYAAFLGVALRRLRVPALPLWAWLGAMTYPLYLIHAGTVGNIGLRYLSAGPARFAIMLGTALFLAWLLAVTIELRMCSLLNRSLLKWISSLERLWSPGAARGVSQ